MPKKTNGEGRYFKNNIVLRYFRFLNLLEPENNVLSISKTFMWVSIILMVIVIFKFPDNLEVILPALAGILTSSANYSYRRWVQYKRNKHGWEFGEADNIEPVQIEIPSVPETPPTVDDPEGDK